MPKDQFDQFNNKRIENIYNFGLNIVQCPSCHQHCEFTEGELENINTLTDDSGNKYTMTTLKHRQKNRLKCNCGTVICIQCKAIP